MTFLPVTERELRVAARRKGTYRTRFVAALIGLLVSTWVFLISQQNVRPDQLGNELFSVLATLAFAYTLIAGVGVTADCLSGEKREGTLGLLFLTDLRGHDVVLGKLAATSMNSMYGLLAIFPVLAIPMVMGGLALDVFWKVILVLTNTLFLSLAAGILVSSVSRREPWAMAGTLLFLLGLTAGIPVLGACYYEYFPVFHTQTREAFMVPFLLPSPVFTYVVALSSGLAGGKSLFNFWQSLALVHLFGWLCLGMAGRAVRFSWQDRPGGSPAARRRERWQRWCYGDSMTRSSLRAQLLDINPFLWLGSRDRLQRNLLWGALAIIAVGFVWGYLKWRNDWLIAPVGFAVMIVLSLILKYWVAFQAIRRLLEVQHEEALELLASTPLTVREMLLGHRLAFRRLFGGPFVAVLVVDILMLLMGLQDTPDRSDRLGIASAMLAYMAMLVADYYALTWVGMWQGLSSRNFTRALSATCLRILVLPWFVMGISLSLVGIFAQSSSLDRELLSWILWWFALGLVADIYFGLSAYRKLNHEFRTVALRRFQPAPARRGWWFF
jgi:ABC-type transport system involved in cytochrome c biogenesis permease component